MSGHDGAAPAPAAPAGAPDTTAAAASVPPDARKVLVLAREDDVTADLVIRQLEARGAGVLRLDTGLLPQRPLTTVTCEDGVAVGRLELGCGHELRTDEITAVWYRRPESAVSAPELLDLIRARRVNDPGCNAAAAYRPAQLRLAAELGLRTPRSMFTNDPGAAREFAARFGGRVVARTTRTLLRPPTRADRSSDRAPATPDAVRHSPCLLHERLAARSELTVVVVGSHVFAAETACRAPGPRHLRAVDEFPLRPYRLPPEIAGCCLALCRHFGLAFATFDFAVTPDGDHVFLDLDPNGEWRHLADLTGLPIAAALADALTAPGLAADID